MALHPAENRGYRELILTAEEARTRLSKLAGHLELEPRAVCDKAAETLGDLIKAITPALAEHELYTEVAARGGGARIGSVRASILDRFLERNQVLRFAVDDLEHIATLLAYLGNVSEAQRKKNLPELCRTWERKVRRQVGLVRKAAVEMGTDPSEAIEPIDPTPVGQAAHGAAVAAGAVGEAVDKAAAKGSKLFDQAGNGDAAAEPAKKGGAAAPAAAEQPKRRGLFRR